MTDAHADARSTSDRAASEGTPRGGWTWIAAIWCAGALFNASQTLLTMHAVGVGKAWLRPFLIVFVSWLPWALATPFVIELARRRPPLGVPSLAPAGDSLANPRWGFPRWPPLGVPSLAARSPLGRRSVAPAGDSLAGPRWGFPRWPLGRRSVAAREPTFGALERAAKACVVQGLQNVVE